MKHITLNFGILLAVPAFAVLLNAPAYGQNQPRVQEHNKAAAKHKSKAQPKKKSTAKNKAAASSQHLDSIVAVVNTEVITQNEVAQRIDAARLTGDNSLTPEKALSDLIDEKLIEDEAGRIGMEVPQGELAAALENIAKSNGLTLEQFHEEALKHGMDWQVYIDNISKQMLMEKMRSKTIRDRVTVTDRDIDAYLKQNPTGVAPDYTPEVVHPEAPPPERRIVVERSFEPKAISFQHIFVRVPDGASEELEQQAREKANEALRKVRGGESFESVARRYSDAPEASSGGNLGIRMFEDWPKLFVTVTKRVKDGGLSGVFKAPNGFHILKVVERRGLINETQREVVVQPPRPKPYTVVDPRVEAARNEGPINVQETHVRHILIRETPVFSSQQAEQKVQEIAQRLASGMSFEEAAQQYSEDTSGPMGGDIGWVPPGQSDPNFEKAMDALQPGQVSAPVHTQFGWHLIQVLDRRTQDKKEDLRRTLARENIFTQRSDAALADWFDQLRARAYIDNRLTGQQSSSNNVGEEN